MSDKSKYLRSVTAQLQENMARLAKLRAQVTTRRGGSTAERSQLAAWQSHLNEIRANLTELAAAGHNEWTAVQTRLDARLSTLNIPAAMDLSSPQDAGEHHYRLDS